MLEQQSQQPRSKLSSMIAETTGKSDEDSNPQPSKQERPKHPLMTQSVPKAVGASDEQLERDTQLPRALVRDDKSRQALDESERRIV